MAENQGSSNNNNSNTSAEENTNTAPSAPIVWLRGEDAGAHRRTWPELVGVSAEEAEKKVKEDMPRARVQVVPPDCFVTMDYRLDRVRLFLDSTGKVARPPTLG